MPSPVSPRKQAGVKIRLLLQTAFNEAQLLAAASAAFATMLKTNANAAGVLMPYGNVHTLVCPSFLHSRWGTESETRTYNSRQLPIVVSYIN